MNRSYFLERRDTIAVESGSQLILVACDSCGSIGEKDNDTLKAPFEVVGGVTVRVPLFEILTIGAKPISVSVTISNEPEKTGERILNGIRKELMNSLGFIPPLVVSTEKNMPTTMTALGITVVGVCDNSDVLICDNPFDHYGFVVGRPSVGGEVLEFRDEIFGKEQLDMLLGMEEVLEIIPCGSSGIYGELDTVLSHLKSRSICEGDQDIDVIKIQQLLDEFSTDSRYIKSCGPSTAAIVIAKSDLSDLLGDKAARLW